MPYGINFQPGAQDQGTGPNGPRPGSGASPLQTAVQLLSLRLPSVVGARALAPQALLEAPGGVGGGFDVVAMLRRLMQQSGAQAPAMPGGAGGPMPMLDLGPAGGAPSLASFAPDAPMGKSGFAPRAPLPRVTPGTEDGQEIGSPITQAPMGMPTGTPDPLAEILARVRANFQK